MAWCQTSRCAVLSCQEQTFTYSGFMAPRHDGLHWAREKASLQVAVAKHVQSYKWQPFLVLTGSSFESKVTPNNSEQFFFSLSKVSSSWCSKSLVASSWWTRCRMQIAISWQDLSLALGKIKLLADRPRAVYSIDLKQTKLFWLLPITNRAFFENTVWRAANKAQNERKFAQNERKFAQTSAN